MPSLARKRESILRRTASRAANKGRKLTQLLSNSIPRRSTGRDFQGKSEASDASPQLSKQTVRKGSTSALDVDWDDSLNFFELLEKLQSGRLDDQRCFLPSYTPSWNSNRSAGSRRYPSSVRTSMKAIPSNCRIQLEKVLSSPSPYPTVVLSPSRSYWLEDSLNKIDETVQCESKESLMDELESASDIDTYEENIAKAYRKYYLGKNHLNFCAIDEKVGPILVSVKPEVMEDHEYWRFLLRRKAGTLHVMLPLSAAFQSVNATPMKTISMTSLVKIAKHLDEELNIAVLSPIENRRCPNLLLAYDEHVIITTHKFGVISQRVGQLTEEELFNNPRSRSMDSFLQNLGKPIWLKGHNGYRGGLDTVDGRTGEMSIYEVFHSREIMFHVSSYLPFNKFDPQQLERKRHIGNDIVAVVFQEGNTPFTPEMITSNFLHAFIVVQVIDPHGGLKRRYKVQITARDEVPSFGPPLPDPPLFYDGQDFHDFLLTKLINAEIACCKARLFAKLQIRTRESLLRTIVEEVQKVPKKPLRRDLLQKQDNKHETKKYLIDSKNAISTTSSHQTPKYFREAVRRTLKL